MLLLLLLIIDVTEDQILTFFIDWSRCRNQLLKLKCAVLFGRQMYYVSLSKRLDRFTNESKNLIIKQTV